MKSKEEILAEKMRLMPSSIDRYKNDNSYRVGVNECLAAMQEYADQETSTLYTRAQMIEFGEKVRVEALSEVNIFSTYQTIQGIQNINIEKLLNK